MSNILVSVFCVTYNHKDYIRDAIESFLKQKVSFEYEIVIHDDASTDGTADIVREYEVKYPKLIRGIYEKENQYSKGESFTECLNNLVKRESRGKYIAECEGDDYWIDNNKLQIQVNYMEQHPECAMTCHDAIRINYRDGGVSPWHSYNQEGILSPEDLIVHWRVPTASRVFRREVLEMEGFFLKVGIGDWPRALYALTRGNVYYFERIMSAYRYDHEGSWTNGQLTDDEKYFEHILKVIDFLKKYNLYTQNAYKEEIQYMVWQYMNRLASSNTDKERFYSLCNLYHNGYMETVKEMYKQFNEPTYCSQMARDFSAEYKYLLIYGAGNYGEIISRQLDYAGIHFEGFVVSDDQDARAAYLGRKVWKLKELPFLKSETGVIVAVSLPYWREIRERLEKEKIAYVYPFARYEIE